MLVRRLRDTIFRYELNSVSYFLRVHLQSADLEGSETVAKLKPYVKQLFKLQCFTQRSLTRKLEPYHCEDVSLVYLKARTNHICVLAWRKIRRYMEQVWQKDGDFARLVAQVEKGQRSHAENVYRLNVVNSLIVKRRAREQELEDEQEEYGSEQDDDESEQEDYDDYSDEQEGCENELSIMGRTGTTRRYLCTV